MSNFNKLRRLDPCKTVFLLCDIQEKFRPVMPLLESLLKNTTKLLQAGKIFDIPLIVTEQYPEKLGKTCQELDICHARVVAEKTRFSMLVPDIQCKLKEIYGNKPENAILFGIESHVCIEQTAMDLIAEKINVFLVADCCCSRLNQDRDLAFERMRQIGCLLTSSESVIFNIMQDKNHPKFNDLRKLVAKPSQDMQISISANQKQAEEAPLKSNDAKKN